LLSLAQARVQFLGVAIAGGDFGCQIDGSCPTASTQLPLSSLGGGDGAGQMKHFVDDDEMNMFRIPISWQFLVNNKLGASVDSNNFGKYDQVLQACLSTGAYCMIDIHNFARWNGGIIGQGGPTDDQFVGLWTQLATKYATSSRVVFELMNEPHDLDINIWAQTCQKVVAAIRNAGATSQMILLPGTNFDSAATLVSSGSAEALLAITNPDGTTDGLLLDVHKYLDVDNSGTHAECVTDNTAAFQTVADFLRQKGRQGIVSETGASSAASCITAFCAQNALINANSDVFTGLVTWAAGSFSPSYLLSLTPNKQGGALVDNALASQCVVRTWLEASAVAAAP
ncbi:cellulase, partial [Coniochaeta ligniaria NRRL 30616]